MCSQRNRARLLLKYALGATTSTGQVRCRQWKISHSTQFSGKEYHRSSKASRREDLQVEEPVACGDGASFDFHPTLAGMLRTPLVGHEVVQMGQPSQKRL
jgi:hypothetical protein